MSKYTVEVLTPNLVSGVGTLNWQKTIGVFPACSESILEDMVKEGVSDFIINCTYELGSVDEGIERPYEPILPDRYYFITFNMYGVDKKGVTREWTEQGAQLSEELNTWHNLIPKNQDMQQYPSVFSNIVGARIVVNK